MTVLLSVLLAGAALMPPTPVEPGSWFTSKAYSKTALMVAERGPIAYALHVAPDGTVLRCETQGSSDLEHKVCDIVTKNARFVAARDNRGQPIFGLYDGMASFLLPGKNGRPDRSRLSVTLDRLPDGVTSPAFARVAFLVDGAGHISQCASTVGERRRFMQTVEALGPAACDSLAKDYRPTVARDAAGLAVASVQSVMVRFETPQAP